MKKIPHCFSLATLLACAVPGAACAEPARPAAASPFLTAPSLPVHTLLDGRELRALLPVDAKTPHR